MTAMRMTAWAAGLMLSLTASAVQAQVPGIGALGLDSNQPIAVNADSFLADLNGNTGIYTGNVIVCQGQVKLHADRVKVSAPSGKATRMEAEGHVVVDSPSGQAVGDSGVYDIAEQTLHLTGHVVLTKDANVLRGSALEVSMATGTARLTAGGEAAVSDQRPARVQGLFAPSQGASPAPPAAPAPVSSCGNPPKP